MIKKTMILLLLFLLYTDSTPYSQSLRKTFQKPKGSICILHAPKGPYKHHFSLEKKGNVLQLHAIGPGYLLGRKTPIILKLKKSSFSGHIGKTQIWKGKQTASGKLRVLSTKYDPSPPKNGLARTLSCHYKDFKASQQTFCDVIQLSKADKKKDAKAKHAFKWFTYDIIVHPRTLAFSYKLDKLAFPERAVVVREFSKKEAGIKKCKFVDFLVQKYVNEFKDEWKRQPPKATKQAMLQRLQKGLVAFPRLHKSLGPILFKALQDKDTSIRQLASRTLVQTHTRIKSFNIHKSKQALSIEYAGIRQQVQQRRSFPTPKNKKKKPLKLTLILRKKGIVIATRGAVLPQGCQLDPSVLKNKSTPARKKMSCPHVQNRPAMDCLAVCLNKIKQLFLKKDKLYIFIEKTARAHYGLTNKAQAIPLSLQRYLWGFGQLAKNTFPNITLLSQYHRAPNKHWSYAYTKAYKKKYK